MGATMKNLKCGYGDLPSKKVEKKVTPLHPEGNTYMTGLRQLKHCSTKK